MATGKSLCASGGKKTSTAFLMNGLLPVGGVPTCRRIVWLTWLRLVMVMTIVKTAMVALIMSKMLLVMTMA